MHSADPQDKAYDSHSTPQFSIRSVWMFVTLLCILLAVPGVIFVGLTLASWLVPGLILMGMLLVAQVPVYFMLQGIRRSEPKITDRTKITDNTNRD